VPNAGRRIEIVGVAGTGKSTLARALVERRPECRLADTLHTRVPAHWPYVAHGLPRALALWASSLRSRPALSWDEVKFLLYVSEWNRYLRDRREHRLGIVVLDQGPVFALARLLWSEKPVTTRPGFQAWVREMVERWSDELDLMVWLDAPNRVLLERINWREQRHDAKHRSTEEALELLDSHHRAYRRLHDLLAELARPPVLRFDTSARSPDALVDELERFLTDEQWLTDRSPALNVR
jgi:adenylate kinase family enzyme